jgi:hypothetical protein
MPLSILKTCISCHQAKELSCFSADNRKPGRRKATCSKCIYGRYQEKIKGRYRDRSSEEKEGGKAKAREYFRKNKDRINERNRAYGATEKGRLVTKKNHAQYRQKNPDHLFIRNLERKGLTAEQYYAMANAQKMLCAICGQPEVGKASTSDKIKRLAVDHHHQSGAIRGLLCSLCNRGIGFFKGDVGRLRQAIAYLEKHGLFSKEEVNETRASCSPLSLQLTGG